MHRKGIAALAGTLTVAALALAAGGCGSSEQPLTKAEFVRQADAVCAHARVQGIALFKTAAAQQRTQQLSDEQIRTRFGSKIAALQRHQLERLEALDPPEAIQAAFAEYKRVVSAEIERGLGPSGGTEADHAALVASSKRREALRQELGIREACI